MRSAKKVRIFVLTDGQVGNNDAVINLVKRAEDNVRIHTFGIGCGCDVNLVTKMAEAGKGHCYLIKDLKTGSLSADVIEALGRACQPTLEGCSIAWNNQQEKLNEVFYNQLISSYRIMSKQDYAKLKFTFECKNDPKTREGFKLDFTQADFTKVQPESGIFKLAAQQKIKGLSGAEQCKVSIAYQVLADTTAFIGTVKQKKSSGEVEQFSLDFVNRERAIEENNERIREEERLARRAA